MNLDQITEWAQIAWPASARAIAHDGDQGIDSIALLRFEMDPAELDSFVGSLGFDRPLRPGAWPFPPLPDAPGWWVARPAEPAPDGSTLGGAVLDLARGLNRELFVDQRGPGVATVYLRTFEV
ncbi:MAG TPA: hypothetical protein VGE07_09700 [Herpetosiphonaceae bacterium]